MVPGTRQLAQHVVREFFALVSPQLANPWTVYGPSKAGIFTATIQAPALPPLCTGGTFSNKHKQQAMAVGNVCERYLQHLADSGVLTHGWRRWPQTWMQEGAPDVMRFLMLTYTLAASPGWVGRQTLLRLRGVPPAARQTASALLDQLIQQGLLQDDPVGQRVAAARPGQQSQQQPQQQQHYHHGPPPPMHQPQPQSQLQPQYAQHVPVKVEAVHDPYQLPVYQQQEQQQHQYQQQQHYQQQQLMAPAASQPYHQQDSQQQQQQGVQVVYLDGPPSAQQGQPVYVAAAGQPGVMQQQQQQVPPQVMYQQQHQEPAVVYQLQEQPPAQQVTYLDATTMQPLQFGHQAQAHYFEQQQQVPPQAPQQVLVAGGGFGPTAQVYAMEQPPPHFQQQQQQQPVFAGPAAGGGPVFISGPPSRGYNPAAAAAGGSGGPPPPVYLQQQQQGMDPGGYSSMGPMQRAAGCHPQQEQQYPSPVGREGASKRPWVPDQGDGYGRDGYGRGHPAAAAAGGPAGGAYPKRGRYEQQGQPPAPHHGATSSAPWAQHREPDRGACFGTSQPGYYQHRHSPAAGATGLQVRPAAGQRQGGTAAAAAAGGGSGGRDSFKQNKKQGAAVAAAGKAGDPPAAGGTLGARSSAAAAAAAAAAGASADGGKQAAAAVRQGPAATGIAAAAAAVLPAALQSAANKGKASKKQQGKKANTAAAAAAAGAPSGADVLHTTHRERQQQRLQGAAQGPVSPELLRRLVVSELCDAAPYAVKVTAMRQRYEQRARGSDGAKGGNSNSNGNKNSSGGGAQHSDTQAQGGGGKGGQAGPGVRDVAALLSQLVHDGRAEVFQVQGKAQEAGWYVRWLDDDWASDLAGGTALHVQPAA